MASENQDLFFLQILDNITKTATALELASKEFFKKFELTRVQFLALSSILKNGNDGITLSALSECMAVSKANITTLTDRMEAAGLISRLSHDKDRRSTVVVVTERGRNCFAQVLPEREKLAGEILSNLTGQEIEEGNRILGKLQNKIPAAFQAYFAKNGRVNENA